MFILHTKQLKNSGLRGIADRGLLIFLEEWFNDKPYVIGHTSGSTGEPKEIRLNKADMQASARITNTFFDIGPDSVLLLCLSVSYIAGKMMVVRALEAGAELWTTTASSRPLERMANSGKRVNLAAMVPMQVVESFKYPEDQAALTRIHHLLIGGAPVSPRLERQLLDIPTLCYATYGMTETVSHVALRKLNDTPGYFALGDISFSADERGCLVICAPHLTDKQFITNDVVHLADIRHFEWLGRYDHVINSGGIKFFPEVIENKISALLSCRFFVTSKPDERLGQRIVLVVEGDIHQGIDDLLRKLRRHLSAYEMPREILCCPSFRETSSGKVIREFSGAGRMYSCDDENTQIH